jgi:hypothetical protein
MLEARVARTREGHPQHTALLGEWAIGKTTLPLRRPRRDRDRRVVRRAAVLPAEARLLRLRCRRGRTSRPGGVHRGLRASIRLGESGDLRCSLVGDGADRAPGRVGRRIGERRSTIRRDRGRGRAPRDRAGGHSTGPPPVGRPRTHRPAGQWSTRTLRSARPTVPPLFGAARAGTMTRCRVGHRTSMFKEPGSLRRPSCWNHSLERC